MNRAMLKIWRLRPCLIMMQDHDALTFMYKEEDEDVIVPKLQEMLLEELQLQHGRTLSIPYDCKVGWNKGDVSTSNPEGLKDYEGHDDRKRAPKTSVFSRIMAKRA